MPRDGTGGVLPLKFQDFSGHLGETSNISWFISMFQIEGVIKKKNYLLDTDFSNFQPKDEGFFLVSLRLKLRIGSADPFPLEIDDEEPARFADWIRGLVQKGSITHHFLRPEGISILSTLHGFF